MASAQQIDYSLRVVLQWTAKPRVVVRSQAGKGSIAKSTRLYRQSLVGEREHTRDLSVKREVNTIFGGSCKVRKSHHTYDKYAQEARHSHLVIVHTTNECLLGDRMSNPKDIIFTKDDANWVHHPHEDTLVVTAKIGNNLVHRILVNNGCAVNILYWDAYQKVGLTQVDLSPTTSPLY